jgi:UDP-N-acetylmuramyl tripeptide synthase
MTPYQKIYFRSARNLVCLLSFISKLLGFGAGSNFPGKVGMALFPGLFKLLIPRFKNGWVLVTGTNGKTTTTKILVELMREMGFSTVTNARGANLISGIITSILTSKTKLKQGFLADWAVFEIDEAVLARAFSTIRPRIMVVTNFSRDQLDRYGEVDSNVNKIIELLKDSDSRCRLILNGNDPNIARIGKAVRPENRLYFGIKGDSGPTDAGLLVENETGSGMGSKTQLPDLDVWAEAIEAHYLSGSRFQLGLRAMTLTVDLKLPGVFNVLNALAAAAVAFLMGGSPERIQLVLGKVNPSYGRSEPFLYRGSPVYLFLVKNPVGFNHILQLLTQAPGRKRILLLLNDLIADGKDVSWIWDVNLENLWKVPGITEVVTSGTRAGDMGLRVKYSEPPAIPLRVDYQPQRAFKELAARLSGDEELMILANYTSMITFRPFLLKVAKSLAEEGASVD